MHPHAACKAVSFKCYLAKNFCEPARADTPVEFHLPESFLRVNIALCEKQVIFVLCINMGHAIAIRDDFYSLVQPVQVQSSLCLGERTTHYHAVCSTGQSGQPCRSYSLLPPGRHGSILLFPAPGARYPSRVPVPGGPRQGTREVSEPGTHAR